VALKMILHAPHAGIDQRRRFQTEAEAIARLRHPNIVQIYEIGEHHGQPYFVLEFIEGGTLVERVARHPLSARETASLTAMLARAIHASHQAGIVHRDLKPPNILLTADGTPKISDFGLAKQLDAENVRTRSGELLGTPAYMAPEQACGQSRAIGPAADIYALGVILYELLTGRTPFRGLTPLDVMQQVLKEEPISLRRLASSLPRDLETICHKCLRKRPEDRYRTALELAEDLERFLTGKPIQARPVPAWERGLKWARRRPAAAGILAVIFLALGMVVGSWGVLTVHMQQEIAQKTSALQAAQEKREEENRRRQEQLRRDLRLDRYVADVRQAAQLWQLGEISQCYDFMTKRRGNEGEDDLCSFAWNYLRHWCDLPPRFLVSPPAADCVRFHPDGALLACCGGDAAVRLWDVNTGTACGLLSGHQDVVTEIAFSPEGRSLVSASRDGSLRLWDVAQRRQLAVLITGAGGGGIERMVWSAQGRYLAFLRDHGGEAQLCEYDTRRARHTWPSGADPALSLAFAPDEQILAIGYGDGRIKLKDVQTGSERDCLLARHSVNALAFAHQSPLLAAAGGDGIVTLWDAQTQERVAEQVRHTRKVNSLAFSPDDRLLLSAGEDGTVRCWDLAAQRPLGIFRARNRPFHTVAFRPDGRLFACGGIDGVIGLWPATVAEKISGPQLAVDAAGPLAFSSDNKWLAVAGLNHTVRLHDPATRQLRRTLYGWYGEWQDLAFSPDGQFLAAACSDHRVHVWDTSRGRPTVQLLGHEASVLCVAYSSDGKWLASGGADHRVALWEMPTGTLRRSFEAHEGPLAAVAFHPKGELLATVGRDKIIKLWSLPDLQLRHAVKQDDEVLGMIFTNEGRTLLVNGESTGVSCRTVSRKQGLSTARSFTGRARFMAIAPSDHLLVVSDLATIYGFDFVAQKQRFYLALGNGAIRHVALSPDGSMLVFSHRGGSLQWWDLKRQQLLTTAEELPYAVHSLAFSAGGQLLISGSRDRGRKRFRTLRPLGIVYDTWPRNTVGDFVRFWSMPAGQSRQRLSEVLTLVNQPLVAVSPDGQRLATAADDGRVGVWDLKSSNRCLHLFVSRHSRTYSRLLDLALSMTAPISPIFDRDQMRALAFAPAGRLLAAASEDGQVVLWDALTGKEWSALPGEHAEVSCLAFSPDGKLLATNNGSHIELWDVSVAKEAPVRLHTLEGHNGTVRSLAFSPDGCCLASGTEDGDVRLWDVVSGMEAKQLQGHVAAVSSLAFHPDGKTLASAGWDGTVRLWHVSAGREMMVLQPGVPLLHSVVFSPDGTTLAAGGERPNGRGEIWFWRSAEGAKP
jgi:eukaryotic-like serine/threonine-protein kinase